MNDQRRKGLSMLAAKIQDVYDAVETLRDDEQEYLDNMPEGIREGDKGDKSQEAIDYLDSAVDALSAAIADIESAIE
jgi:NADPH-dependent glutamate synthase beta subunit-like oxidoreductase